jgi:hypothetical protein
MQADDSPDAVAPPIRSVEKNLPSFALSSLANDGETVWAKASALHYRYVVSVSLDEVLAPSLEVGSLAQTFIGIVVAVVC